MTVTSLRKEGVKSKINTKEQIKSFIEEDLGTIGDITSNALLSNEKAKATIIANQECVIAGLEEAKEVFTQLNLKVESNFSDGENIPQNASILMVEGSAKSILAGERLALNLLMRLSGIATQTNKLVKMCRKINPNIVIAATRKTTPGLRYYEKKAVQLGGGKPHRYGLYDAILIKDNHLEIVGSVTETIRRAKKTGKQIEIEVENMDDALNAAMAGADIIMLDNMKPKDVEKTCKKLRKIKNNIIIEVSGGITPNNIRDYAKFVDIISLGMLTHSVQSIDFSLKIEKVIKEE